MSNVTISLHDEDGYAKTQIHLRAERRTPKKRRRGNGRKPFIYRGKNGYWFVQIGKYNESFYTFELARRHAIVHVHHSSRENVQAHRFSKTPTREALDYLRGNPVKVNCVLKRGSEMSIGPIPKYATYELNVAGDPTPEGAKRFLSGAPNPEHALAAKFAEKLTATLGKFMGRAMTEPTLRAVQFAVESAALECFEGSTISHLDSERTLLRFAHRQPWCWRMWRREGKVETEYLESVILRVRFVGRALEVKRERAEPYNTGVFHFKDALRKWDGNVVTLPELMCRVVDLRMANMADIPPEINTTDLLQMALDNNWIVEREDRTFLFQIP
jgi:hypothetical protein